MTSIFNVIIVVMLGTADSDGEKDPETYKSAAADI